MKPILFVFFFVSVAAAGQTGMYRFSVDGTINLDTGTVTIELLFPSSDYYPQELHPWKTSVANKKFFISGEIPGSIGVRLSCMVNNRIYRSDEFVLDRGNQTVTYNTDSPKQIRVDNASMKLESSYRNALAHASEKIGLIFKQEDSLARVYGKNIPTEKVAKLKDDLAILYRQSDEAKIEFIRKNPGSYLAFWKFVYLFQGWGYEPHYAPVYNLFSNDIKNSFAGKALEKNLKIAEKLAPGKELPFKEIVDLKGAPLDRKVFSKSKFTLVDLWFSSCGPCRAQFPKLIDLYGKYHARGFNIAGISTDKTQYKEDWIKAIKEEKLPWLQYWDKDGKECASLSIHAFPTSFLLDSQGKIIKKNITPVELDVFLESHF